MTSPPVVRQASSKDVPQILTFIRDGGEEQSPGNNIAATEEMLLNTLYLSDVSDNKPRFGRPLLIFSPDGKPAGLLIYFFNYTTWSAAPGAWMEEIYVVPEYRRHGYARLLVQALAAIAKEAGCIKMEWLCLRDNAKALRFYEKLGAVQKDDWTVLKVDEDGIGRLLRDV
ncbi:hypothetical protein FGSG_11317 [Fusarium graminearum PH-1]|uniref:Chromosome 3, complete genome n=1 Tax=Gibberella zeae (strain ATCC MYA-4620 / CBS 123657 / FGSC 9075 / NRRL 31084 / PH-1) TaxID=229533 RepID=I1S3D9_GIBZE|nr:hypothetical protein FGSG_11317 [Fusarium graminearum PH-1]ESU18305.1 hypothetical protein FGSG_11317 [Fusarium graminearum PH-1]EYB22996.1 hypothetical protein FG05_11317 [Fusarium graminearum]CAG1996557.1 unnamed protein product [Fusarium graminearum]CEF86762.1 unnamed protein product [Fusarium graminearum]|eukprot:XP_011325927.1 hypothetical protein FGSG_11317 [Fusarium graminearum PH-1]